NALFALQSLRVKSVNRVMLLFTLTATAPAWWTFAIVVNVLYFLGIHFSYQELILKALFAPLTAWFIGAIIKRLVARPRPSLTLKELSPIAPLPDCGSFPSSHASGSGAFFFSLWY